MPIPILNPREFYDQVEPTDQAGLKSGTSMWLEEVLIPDARSGLTPAQMVDQKLQAVLGCRYRGIFNQLTGRPGNMRRTASQ